MEQNVSPWLEQLARTRPLKKLESSVETDIAIVGGGIAGISTAYFTLKNTPKRVTLLESGRIAHGATGHNAGQLVSYFERQISDLVREFGLEMAADAQRSIDSAWGLIEEIYADAGLATPFYQFTGYAGCMDMEEVLVHLENARCYRDSGIDSEELLIADEWEHKDKIPTIYDGLYSLVPHSDVLALLETGDRGYIAAVAARKGCMNSALFTEELAGYLLAAYPSRFDIFEETHIETVRLAERGARLESATGGAVECARAVLCTNGFEKFAIENAHGPEIDTSFHHSVRGSVGYMAGYLDERDLPPTAVSYLPHRAKTGNEAFDSDPYFYLTRRPLEEDGRRHNLVCIGGPESLMDDTNGYTKEHPYSDEAQRSIDEFVRSTYKHAPAGDIRYRYRWHGLMGYTPNGVRRVGAEPKNPVLLYNLGCNGVGILPSIYGGRRISWILAGKDLPPSIFDPAA